MNLFKSNYFERAFAGNGLQSIIYYLRKLVNGFDANTQTSDGGGIEGVNSRLTTTNSKLEDVKTKLDTLDISVKIDDPDIAQINSKLGDVKTDVHTISTNSTSQGTELHSIYTILDERLVKKLWITRADYDQLVLDDEVDPETLYIVIESQSNPNP